MPYFDISEYGKGLMNMVWKGRGMYVFDRFPSWLIVTAKNQPMVLNGDDSTILEAGDGRSNRIVCQKKFHNEHMCWQEEKGIDGGCLTLFEGYSPQTFGKLVLSNKVGTFNANTAVVVDGVLSSTVTDEEPKTMAYFLSHYGVMASNGKDPWVISDRIQNYFDPTKPECIRNGYEDKMWLKYDSTFNVIRIGLVSGSSATECNVFPVYDIVDGTWSFDVLAQALACMEEIEAGSGNVTLLQVGGGVDDGFVYQLNTGRDDVDTAIDGYGIMEIDGEGSVISLTEIILRMKKNTGNCRLTLYEDGVAQSYTKILSPLNIPSEVAMSIIAMNGGGTLTANNNRCVITVDSVADQILNFPAASSTDPVLQYTIVKLGAGKLTIQMPGSAAIDDSTGGGTIYCEDTGIAFLVVTLVGVNRWVTTGTNTWVTT
jgi:hypothetical protein